MSDEETAPRRLTVEGDADDVPREVKVVRHDAPADMPFSLPCKVAKEGVA